MKATELLALYMLQGVPAGISEQLDKHFESAQKAAASDDQGDLENVLRWLHVVAHDMVMSNSKMKD